jgi:hypothetical protein
VEEVLLTKFVANVLPMYTEVLSNIFWIYDELWCQKVTNKNYIFRFAVNIFLSKNSNWRFIDVRSFFSHRTIFIDLFIFRNLSTVSTIFFKKFNCTKENELYYNMYYLTQNRGLEWASLYCNLCSMPNHNAHITLY